MKLMMSQSGAANNKSNCHLDARLRGGSTTTTNSERKKKVIAGAGCCRGSTGNLLQQPFLLAAAAALCILLEVRLCRATPAAAALTPANETAWPPMYHYDIWNDNPNEAQQQEEEQENAIEMQQQMELELQQQSLNQSLSGHGRHGKVIHLFPVPVDGDCLSNDNRRMGNCLNAYECRQKGGQAQGECAMGFGVCCVFLASCNVTITNNITYIVSPSFPSFMPSNFTGCRLRVKMMSEDISQLRIDFHHFTLGQPNRRTGVCEGDAFNISGGPGGALTLCGQNSGQHLYYDVGARASPRQSTTLYGSLRPVDPLNVSSSSNATTGDRFIDISLSLSNRLLPLRIWEMSVVQIPFSQRAPAGCLQYHTGLEGVLQTFNFAENGRHLANQNYRICVRQETDMCSIMYQPCDEQSFRIGGGGRMSSGTTAFSLNDDGGGTAGSAEPAAAQSDTAGGGATAAGGGTTAPPANGVTTTAAPTSTSLMQMLANMANSTTTTLMSMMSSNSTAASSASPSTASSSTVAMTTTTTSTTPTPLRSSTAAATEESTSTSSSEAPASSPASDDVEGSGGEDGTDDDDGGFLFFRSPPTTEEPGFSRRPRPVGSSPSGGFDLFGFLRNAFDLQLGRRRRREARQFFSTCTDRITMPCIIEDFIGTGLGPLPGCEPVHCGAQFCSSGVWPCRIESTVTPFYIGVHFGDGVGVGKGSAEDNVGACLRFNQVQCM
ncbi:uncharacterized protein LOC117901360 [Drosophila subobscura]|uniref:uncharacterized protein LOC117901360 n=1 Tax=Drosophila subobscura TaxID=7241 RepID=UPI00155A53F2|nr:uncharacterized protein LOC117901360 [Drosophila subobscura]